MQDFDFERFLQETQKSATTQQQDTREQNLDFIDSKLSLKSLYLGLALFFGAIFLLFPKIYLSNKIYYTSKEVLTLQTSKDILLEENKRLARERESIEFRFKVLDNKQ